MPHPIYPFHPAWLGLALALACAGCAKNPNERVTGDAGRMLRVSSKQITVDLDEAQRAELARLQDRRIGAVGGARALAAGADALTAMGFAPVKSDAEVLLVEGERNRIVGNRWRAAIRALIKAKGIPLRGKPDHESMRALISIRPSPGEGTLVRARFDLTVWDTNGDSRTTTVLDGALYACFFERLDDSLDGRKPRSRPPAAPGEVEADCAAPAAGAASG